MESIKYLLDKYGLIGGLLVLYVLKELGILNAIFIKLGIKKSEIEKEPESDLNDLEGRMKMAEGRIESGRDHHFKLLEKFEGHMGKEELEEGRFIKLETGQEHLKENISDIKGSLQEMRETQKDGFKVMGDIKNMIIDALKK